MDLSSKNQRSSDSSDRSSGISSRSSENTSVPHHSMNENAVSATPSPGVVDRYHKFVKSEADKRLYRGLVLTNRMKVLLVSDPSADMTAGALEVQVGSYNDPDEIPGLAHFCEHMVFLGTEKYPEENEFDKFLGENGGWFNAATRSDSTVFYFAIPPPHLNKALDIFAQFFISPLFTESATDRELNAVHSEYESNLGKDFVRLYQIPKYICDGNHPFSKFTTGNKDTLRIDPELKGINVRKELLKFHDKWYSANIMSLVVFGKESLDELEAIVAPLFSAIKDKSVTAPFWPINPFPPELGRKKIYGIPIKDTRDLEMVFPVPYAYCMYYKSQPAGYLAHLMHHKGPGSLMSVLKKRGWCDNIYSGICMPARGFSFFNIEVELTEEGINHVDDIVGLIFQYIAMLKTKGPQEWVWEERKKQMEMNFRFKDTPYPEDVVEDYAGMMQEYPIEDVLSAYCLNPEWKPELITEMLSHLTPENMNLYVVGKMFEDKCTMTVPRYGTKYWVENIEEITLKGWKEVQLNEELHLPPPNDFIPSNLDLDNSVDPTCEDIVPAIIKDTKLIRVWYKKDNEFLLPKAMITLELISPLAYSDPVNANLTKMLVENLSDSLQEISSSASLGGLSLSVTRNPEYGINITVDGYDDKIHVLLDIILDRLVSFKAEPKRFDIKAEGIVRDMKNTEADEPIELAHTEECVCLSSVIWNLSHDLEAVQELTPKQLEEFTAQFIRKVHIEGLMYGNLSRERALQIADAIEQKFPKDGIPLMAEHLLFNRDIELDKGVWFVREIQTSVHCSSCACIYYGCGENETNSNLMLRLLVNLISEPCFTTLRTNEQLGYVVSSTSIVSHGCLGLRVTVQSDRHPYILEQRIEAFVQGFLKHLENMSDEEFSTHKEAVLSRILEKPKKMSSKFYGLWSEIYNQMYNFDRERVEMEHLKTITKNDMVQFHKRHFSSDSLERQKLSVYVVSTAEDKSGIENTEHPKDEVDQKDVNKDLHGKETAELDDMKADKMRTENYVPDEIETAKNKLDKEVFEETKIDSKSSDGEEDKKKHFTADSLDHLKLSIHVKSTTKSGAVHPVHSVGAEHPKEEPDDKALNKEVRDKVTEETNETKTENHVPDETKSEKVNDIDENENDVDKPDKKDFVESKIDGKGFDEEENKKKHFSAHSSDHLKLSMHVKSTTESEAVNDDNKHPKEEPDDKALNKEVSDKVTEESNETKIENHVPGETESVKNIVNELDENKKYFDKTDKEVGEETKLSSKGFDEEVSEEKVLEPERGKKPFEISTLKTEKEMEIITDLLEYRSRRKLYPNPKPFMNIKRKGIYN